MKTLKMSLSAIEGVLSKAEMKKIMAGSYCAIQCTGSYSCRSSGNYWCCIDNNGSILVNSCARK